MCCSKEENGEFSAGREAFTLALLSERIEYEAIQAYERALRLDPGYEDTRYDPLDVRRMRDRGRVQQ
jgi:hypothetical protein